MKYIKTLLFLIALITYNNITFAEPKKTLAEPKKTLAEPIKTLAKPITDSSEARKTLAEPLEDPSAAIRISAEITISNLIIKNPNKKIKSLEVHCESTNEKYKKTSYSGGVYLKKPFTSKKNIKIIFNNVDIRDFPLKGYCGIVAQTSLGEDFLMNQYHSGSLPELVVKKCVPPLNEKDYCLTNFTIK